MQTVAAVCEVLHAYLYFCACLADLVWFIWTTLEIYLIVLLDTHSCAPPDCEHPLTKVVMLGVHVFLV